MGWEEGGGQLRSGGGGVGGGGAGSGRLLSVPADSGGCLVCDTSLVP